MDSLMSLTLRNRLEGSLRLRLPATLAWAHPTVDALTRFLSTQLSWGGAVHADARASAAPAVGAPPPQDSDFDGMSTEALAELLARELAAGGEAP